MCQRLAFVGITVLGSIVALPGVPHEFVAQASTPAPPQFIPAWVLGGGAFYRGQQTSAPGPAPSFNDVDPGAIPDQTLFAGVLDASETTDVGLETNCPGIGPPNYSTCNPYKYISMLILTCNTTLSADAFDALNTGGTDPDETAFLHQFTGMPGPANRLTGPGNCPPPTGTNGFAMNPGDAGFQTYLLSNVWTTGNFPVPYGIDEDHFAADGGGGQCYQSQEYGGRACNVPGNSGSPEPYDWETALGGFESNAEANCMGTTGTCFPFIGNGLTPGSGQTTPPCNHSPPPPSTSTYCFATPEAGVVNDMDALDNLCAAADSNNNLEGITAEEIVFLKGTPPSPVPANTQTIVYMINTMSHLVNYTSGGCKKTVAIDVEAPGGSFYPLDGYAQGTVTGGISTRLEATALRFLVANPKTLVPDRMQPFYYTIGGTNNNWTPTTNSCNMSPYCEVPYMFEETLVPQGFEKTVNPFTWNGSVTSVGDGCSATSTPSPGDTGGAVDLVATCVTADSDPGAAVFLQEYRHLYIAGNDYGPAAVLLNTASTTSVPISSSWFSCPSGCDPLSHFHFSLVLNGGELSSVLTSGSPITMLCTNTTFCTSHNSVSDNTGPIGVTPDILPHSGMILLGSH